MVTIVYILGYMKKFSLDSDYYIYSLDSDKVYMLEYLFVFSLDSGISINVKIYVSVFSEY